MEYFFDDCSLLSNSVVDYIDVKDFTKAEEACERLLKEYPDLAEGLERYAQLYEAKGEIAQAIEYHQKALKFIQNHSDYTVEAIDRTKQKISRLQAKLDSK